jgi:hypothetical protein
MVDGTSVNPPAAGICAGRAVSKVAAMHTERQSTFLVTLMIDLPNNTTTLLEADQH